MENTLQTFFEIAINQGYPEDRAKQIAYYEFSRCEDD